MCPSLLETQICGLHQRQSLQSAIITLDREATEGPQFSDKQQQDISKISVEENYGGRSEYMCPSMLETQICGLHNLKRRS